MRRKRCFPPGSDLRSSALDYINDHLTKEKNPDKIRRTLYRDNVKHRKFKFFTNAPDINYMAVSELYHHRWIIEPFFKWLKEHLKIITILGETENALRIQIYAAITDTV